MTTSGSADGTASKTSAPASAAAPPKLPFLSAAAKEFLAGGIAGAASTVAGYPLDTVRVRLQQPHNKYSGLAHGLRTVVRTEGAMALFRGMGPPLSTVALQNAVLFHAYGTSERILKSFGPAVDLEAPSTLSTIFWAGCMGGVVQAFVITPVDLLKVRLQVCKGLPGAPRGPLALGKSILRAEGIRGLFRGLPITIIRDTPSHGIYFGLYQIGQNFQHREQHIEHGSGETALSAFISGGVAGIVSWWSVYPLDVIKSRIQASQGLERAWMKIGTETIKNEGWGALMKGIGATTVRAFLVNGVIFSVYDFSMRTMQAIGA